MLSLNICSQTPVLQSSSPLWEGPAACQVQSKSKHTLVHLRKWGAKWKGTRVLCMRAFETLITWPDVCTHASVASVASPSLRHSNTLGAPRATSGGGTGGTGTVRTSDHSLRDHGSPNPLLILGREAQGTRLKPVLFASLLRLLGVTEHRRGDIRRESDQ